MSLAVERLLSPNSRAVSVAMVHGFTQNAACMRPFGALLRTALQAEGSPATISLIDAPGHGSSEHDSADLIDAARLCVEAGGTSHYVGYSMGGRMLLHAAVLFPEAFESLTLIGATAGIEDSGERARRLTADEALADRLESEGLEVFLDFWLGLPLFAGLSDDSAGRAERLENRLEGLAASLRHCGTGNQYPLWDHLTGVDVPVLVIAGSGDQKFTSIGRRLADSLPNARFEAIDGGHAVHSEQPDATAHVVAHFIAGQQGAPIDGS